jgi:citrate synthase
LIETPTFPGIDAAASAADPEARLLAYRGYPVQELCRRCSFEEVAYLLWHGELPTRDQIYAQNHAERAQRALDPQVAAALAGQPSTAHPMDTLELAVGMLGAADAAEQHEVTPAATRADALRLYAALPTIVALDQRRRHGLGAVAPRGDLSYAANFLYMTFGKVPEPQVVAAFEKSLILHAGHRSSGRPSVTVPRSRAVCAR